MVKGGNKLTIFTCPKKLCKLWKSDIFTSHCWTTSVSHRL